MMVSKSAISSETSFINVGHISSASAAMFGFNFC